jgi:hypothetical protein
MGSISFLVRGVKNYFWRELGELAGEGLIEIIRQIGRMRRGDKFL